MPVQFDEQNFSQMQNSNFGQPKGISAKLINWGIAKDQKSANVVLIVVLILALVLTLFLIFSTGSSKNDFNTENYPEANPQNL